MLNKDKRNRLETIAVSIAHLRGKKTQVESEVHRLAATVTKAILEGRDPAAEHRAKKEELAACDAEIAGLQSEAQEIVTAVFAGARAVCQEHNDAVFNARRNAGDKLREFLTLWYALEDTAAPLRKALKDDLLYIDNAMKRVGGIQVLSAQRVDPDAPVSPKPAWNGGTMRRCDGEGTLIAMAECLGTPFKKSV